MQGTRTAALPETDKAANPGASLQVVAYVSCLHTTVCDKTATNVELLVTTRRDRAQQHYQRLTRDQTTLCEIASYIKLLAATCRERAQQHYQRLTRELTQGQLLRLGHRDSFIQQASFVLLKGELYVRGETEGDTLSVSGCDCVWVQSFLDVGRQACFQRAVSVFECVFGFRGSLMLAGRHTSEGSFSK